MANEPTIVKQGYMHRWRNDKSVWQPLFFALHGHSIKNAARLDWYDTQEQFLQNPGMRKALFMEEVKDCKKIPYTQESQELYGSSARYLLMIHAYRTTIPDYVLMCSSEDLLTEWHDCLTSLLQQVQTKCQVIRTSMPDKPLDPNDIYNPSVFGLSSYKVQVSDTAAAAHCNLYGVYQLLLSQQHITLADLDTGSHIITWMYKHIRRFGYCDKSFTIEAGSRCETGQGLFIFITDQGRELMKAICERKELLKKSPEQDFSNIPFDKPHKIATPDPFPDLIRAADKKLRAEPNNYHIEKQSSPQKRLINVADQSGNTLSDPLTQPLQTQPKMSEVLSQFPQQNIQGKEGDIYGYSQLNLKGMTPKVSFTAELENPYGEQLFQKIKNSNEVTQ